MIVGKRRPGQLATAESFFSVAEQVIQQHCYLAGANMAAKNDGHHCISKLCAQYIGPDGGHFKFHQGRHPLLSPEASPRQIRK